MKTWLLLAALAVLPLAASAQSLTGAVRIEVRDPSGSPVVATGTIASDATSVRRAFVTDAGGVYMATGLPFGPYRITVEQTGFAPEMAAVDVRSELPVDRRVRPFAPVLGRRRHWWNSIDKRGDLPMPPILNRPNSDRPPLA